MFEMLRPWLTLRRSPYTLACLLGLVCTWGHAQAPSAEVSTPHIRAELVAHAPQGVQAGQPLWVGLRLTHQPEWHTYWQNPGDSGLPTQIEFNLPPGVQAGEVQWPLPRKLKAGSLTNYGYEGTVLLAVPLQVSRAFQAAPTLDIQVHANWLVCRLECIPQEGDFSLSIPTQSSTAGHRTAFETTWAQQPQARQDLKVVNRFDGQRWKVQVEGLPASWQGQKLSVFPRTPELLESAAEQHPQAQQFWKNGTWTAYLPQSTMRTASPKTMGLLLVGAGSDAPGGISLEAQIDGAWPAVMPSTAAPAPSTSQDAGLWLAWLGAFVGGLILNLMPCVLPVLAIKVLGFAQHSRQHHAHRVAGLAYTAGVLVSFLALGGAVLALRAAGEQLGWGFQLQSPWVVSALAALFTLIALNLFGMFDMGHLLPQRLATLQARHPVIDAALSGVLAVAVASPCTAPFMGASLGLAMTLPTWQALSIFAAMGLGLATPYLLASWLPAVARRLPHPGPWMVTLRQLLGFPMLATVAWLLWVLGQQTSLDAAMAVLAGLLLLAASVWARQHPTRGTRVLSGVLALALVVGIVQFNHLLNEDATTSTAPSDTTWQAWSEESVANALQAGRPVFVDFTAAWCVTCQINKKTTLSNAEVLADFAAHQVTLLRADWTRRDPAITAALSALGRSGVPVYVLYAPNQAPMVLSELLSTQQMHDALRQLPQ